MKTSIIAELGQSDIMLPSLISEGLRANDRIKVRLSALQAAAQRARAPDRPATDLSVECQAGGVEPAAIAALIRGARLLAGDRVAAPGLGDQFEAIDADMNAMIRAVAVGAAADGDAATARFAAIRATGLLEPAEDIEASRVARLTGIGDDGEDSLHRLVMDLHKALNRLAAGCAEEIVDGARAFGLRAEDHAIVESFMRGLDQTRALKFDHPGLDTMATRTGDRLLIQNDIGTTDAHVMVIAVEADTVTVTYSDVHRARAKFFVARFDAFAAVWSGLDRKTAEGLGDDGVFYLVTGQYHAQGRRDRDAFLAAVGASLVFLIDWNKARKVLRSWVQKADAVRILDWAARQQVGHRAFLELGGADLIGAAVRNAATTRIGFGERLDGVLGREAANGFLKAVLRICAEALIAGRSLRLVRDHVEADLVRRLERVDSALLAIVVRQVGLSHDLASALAHHIAELRAGHPVAGAALADRARLIEEKADRIALDARNEIARFGGDALIEQLVDRIEDAIDDLEQAAFIASLVPPATDPALLKVLADLCAIAIAAAEAAASGLTSAADAPDGRRVDSDDALNAVVRLIDAEHAADAREREITVLVFGGGFDLHTSLSVLELARAIERATDRFAGFGHLVRRFVMTDLSA